MTQQLLENHRKISVDFDKTTRRFNFVNPLESALAQGDILFFINNADEEVVALSAPFKEGSAYPLYVLAIQRIEGNIFHSSYTLAQEGSSSFMVPDFGSARVHSKNPAFSFYDEILRRTGR